MSDAASNRTDRTDPVVVAGVAAALALAHRHKKVIAFERTWSDVDRARTLIVAAGLAGRIRVHHIDALRWVPKGARPALRSARSGRAVQ